MFTTLTGECSCSEQKEIMYGGPREEGNGSIVEKIAKNAFAPRT